MLSAIQLVQDITGGFGVDVAVEALGKPQTFSQCVQSVRDGGKAVMIGLTLSGSKGEVDINHLVRRQVCAFVCRSLLVPLNSNLLTLMICSLFLMCHKLFCIHYSMHIPFFYKVNSTTL